MQGHGEGVKAYARDSVSSMDTEDDLLLAETVIIIFKQAFPPYPLFSGR